MMMIKGVSLFSTREFIKNKFGEEGYGKWLAAVKPKTRELFEKPILSGERYPISEGLSDPTETVCRVFYAGSIKGAWEMGRFSAETGLKGVYRIFLRIASPEFILERAGRLFSEYYSPSTICVAESVPGRTVLRISDFEGISDVIEHRIAGWFERALELCGKKDISVEISKSCAKRSEISEFVVSWK